MPDLGHATERLATLRRMITRAPAPSDATQRCQLCNAAVPERHRHLLDEHDGTTRCVCQACRLLFERDAAGRGHFQLIPARRVRLSGLAAADLNVPVGLAFFVEQADSTVVGHYPSPLGSTTCDVDPDKWRSALQECAELQTLQSRVEAVLVNSARDADEQWIVPIDDCYRLVAVIREHWRGMSGGTTVWPAIEQFFEDLDNMSHAPSRGTAKEGNHV